MEVIFILGVVTFIIMQFVSKSLNSATNIKKPISGNNKPIIIEEENESSFPDSRSEENYPDIHVDKRVKKNKKKSDSDVLNTSSAKENTSLNENHKPKQIITLNNISEAKRAFIYSEIFNRKY